MPVIFYSGLRQWEYYPGPLFGYLHLTVPAPTPWVTLFNVIAVSRSRVNSLSPLTQPRCDATSKLERATDSLKGRVDRHFSEIDCPEKSKCEVVITSLGLVSGDGCDTGGIDGAGKFPALCLSG